ncbi:hypothetical protein JH146_1459 [Methanocaldococcus bathoardescens]|uniref:Alpha-(1->3)-arabinofuranosyltransferase N-terminal GT-C domain-containing protein n=1 Tax=Methanocaldococcus bathoardescens TaxID=1301915 RepID=A0A076LDK2_9EURY|nr:alpha-(1->3)-arabinofuranosyltransferase family protein [Methanocaldococcus bathoardescens]AIJ06301.1 hypothetical protein JH146_1459 [Methanocaldococcus bathoardescens]
MKNFILIMLFFLAFFSCYYLDSSINYVALGDPPQSLVLNPSLEFKDYFYKWQETNFGGSWFPMFLSGRCLLALFVKYFEILFPPKFISLFIIFGSLVFSSVGFYKLIRDFYLKEYNIINTVLIASIFYGANLHLCIEISHFFFLLIPYILTPWILYYSFKYITSKKSKYLITTSFLLSFFGLAPNPPTVIISLIIIVWTILTFKFINKWSFKELLTKGIKIASLSFLLSFWWILPILTYKLYFTNQFIKTLHMELFYSGNSTLLNVFHLSGYWELFIIHYRMKVFYFSDILWKIRPVLIILSALIIFGAFIYYKTTNNRKDKIILLSYFILFLFGLLLAQGYHPTSIIKDIYFYLITHSPFFGTFRNNYKWVAILAFCYSIFIPYAYLGYKNLLNKLTNNQKIRKTLPYLIIILFLLTSSFPIWTGTLINHYFEGIPQESYEVSNYLNGQIKEDYGKVMIMPGTWLSYYKWGYYSTNRPIFVSFIEDRSALIYRYGGEPPLSWYGKELVDDMLYRRFFEFNISTLKNLGIKYILIDRTLDTRLGKEALPTADVERIEEHLKKKGFKLIYKGKNYSVYKLPNASSSLIWIPSKIYYINGSLTTNDKFILINTFDIRKVAIVNSKSSINKINFTKKNETYVIDITNQNLGRFRYGTWPWVYKEDKISVSQSNNSLDINLSLHEKYSVGQVGIEFYNPIDLSNSIVKVRIKPDKPLYNLGLQVFLMDENKLWTHQPPLYLDNFENTSKIYEINLSLDDVTDINKRKIKWIQIGFENRNDYPVNWTLKLDKDINIEKEILLIDMKNNNNETKIFNNYKLNYTKINPTLWKVQVNATKPFMLSFAESYDPLWEARIYKDGKLVEKVSPVPLYGVINGFYINETGNLKIVIRYKPQDWFEIGLATSGITFLACITYLFYDWRREKRSRGKST